MLLTDTETEVPLGVKFPNALTPWLRTFCNDEDNSVVADRKFVSEFSPTGGGNADMRRVCGGAMAELPMAKKVMKAAMSLRMYMVAVKHTDM